MWNIAALIYSNFDFISADYAEKDLLPHQEAKLKAGLEKAVQHKEKLLEYDRNRYGEISFAVWHFNWKFQVFLSGVVILSINLSL